MAANLLPSPTGLDLKRPHLVKTESLRVSESLLLDIIRVSAAIIVIIGHLTQKHFSKGWPDLTPVARAAVTVFFVLSGFVIRHVTLRRESTLEAYLRDRTSRIYSVVIPALLITVIADGISQYVNPGFYLYWARIATHPLTGIVLNLSFLAQLWSLNLPLLSNSPFWSLNYEVAYYIIYGCAIYLRGAKRWIWTGLFIALFGPKILLLFPIWILGCVAHDLYQRWNSRGTTERNLNRTMLGIVAVLAIAIVALRPDLGVHHAIASLKSFLTWKQRVSTDADPMFNIVGAINALIFGFLGAVAFLKLLSMSRRLEISDASKNVARLRFIAEGTFPLYLFHFPLLVLIAACIPYNHSSVVEKLAILFGIIVFCIFMGAPCNALKLRIRAMLKPKVRDQVAK